MLNVLLVEDDIVDREIMLQSWVWQKSEFVLFADVASGLEAWEILKQGNIDIVITDIKMPVMGGLELSKLIHDNMPNVKIIILSGYSDFQYARQALSLGVSEYLVKTVRSDDLLQALRKVAAKLQEETQTYQEIQNYRELLQKTRAYQRLTMLENLSIGISSVENQVQQAELLGFSLDFESVCCAIIAYLDDKILINDSEHLMILESQQAVDTVIENLNVISFAHNLHETYLIFKNPQLPEVKTILRNIHAGIVSQQQKSHWLTGPIIALGGKKNGIAGIAESFTDARFLLNFQHLMGDPSLLFVDEVQPMNQLTYTTERVLRKAKEDIVRLMDNGSKIEIPGLVDGLISQLQTSNLSLIFFQFTIIEIGNMIRHFLLQIGEDADAILSEQDGTPNKLISGNIQNWSNDLPALGQYLALTLGSVIDIRNRKRRYQATDVIVKAKKYIDLHYDDPTLNLTSISAVVNLNPSYFSSLFSHEMGSTFIEYLTAIRIEKAKTLLKSTNLSSLEIAFTVGFSDSNYFSKIFKKITSESPRSYKKRKVD